MSLLVAPLALLWAAAALAALVAADPSTALALAQLVPGGWPRLLFVIAIATATYVLPMKAQQKDGADGRG